MIHCTRIIRNKTNNFIFACEGNPIGNNSVLCDLLCDVQDATHCTHIIDIKQIISYLPGR